MYQYYKSKTVISNSQRSAKVFKSLWEGPGTNSLTMPGNVYLGFRKKALNPIWVRARDISHNLVKGI